MFKRGMRLPVTLLGIPLILDWSFLLILPFLAFMIGSRIGIFAEMFDVAPVEPLTDGFVPYVLGLIAAIGLFLGVILHELGHAVTARLYGVKVRSITLWFLGGVAQFEEMPRQRGAEAVVAIVGPLVSLALAVICWFVLRALPAEAVRGRFVFEYLTYMNVVLAIFNMIPALPLDGGRVLRSLLAMRMPVARATQISATVSRVFAFGIGLLGVLSMQFFLLLIAVFIFMAVSAETTTARVEDLLRDVPVSRIMNRHVSTVPPDMRLGELAQRMLQERHLGFPVVTDGRVLGWVTIAEVQGKEPGTAVAEVMAREVQSIGE
jgi:Zn-dependent protease